MIRASPRASEDGARRELAQSFGDGRDKSGIFLDLRLHALRRFLGFPRHGCDGLSVHPAILTRSFGLRHAVAQSER